jgi:pSer/pThr/pTyr-binding forkhead associated (FHA) protein
VSVSFKIKIFDSQGTHVQQVAKSTLTIGGAAHCDVVVGHASVAPEHTRAWLEGGRIWVQDLGSASGTALNDIRLPALKPMLVRDLDVLRLGQSETTLGLEAVLVRAPVVKGKAEAVESEGPVTESKNLVRDLEAEKRREQIATLGRELADLRLQLQMTKLEKGSNEEMVQQLQKLRDEIKTVQEQKSKWSETLRQMEDEKQTMRKAVEDEVAEFKRKSLADLKAQRDRDGQKLAGWKKDTAGELARSIHDLISQKARVWSGQALSQPLTLELEEDFGFLLRKVLLNDQAAPPIRVATVKPVTVPALTITMSDDSDADSDAATVVVSRRQLEAVASVAAPATRKKEEVDIGNAPTVVISARRLEKPREEKPRAEKRREETSDDISNEATVVHVPRSKPSSRRRLLAAKAKARRQLTLTSIILAVVMISLWAGTAYFRRSGGHSSLSSQITESNHKAKIRFEPKQTHKIRNTYTDNVLYLENYVAAEENPDFHRHWLTELDKTVTQDWKMDKSTANPIVAKEQVLIEDLSHIREGITVEREQQGITQMRSREAAFLKDLESMLKGRAAVERFLKFKRAFYSKNQAYLTAN